MKRFFNFIISVVLIIIVIICVIILFRNPVATTVTNFTMPHLGIIGGVDKIKLPISGTTLGLNVSNLVVYNPTNFNDGILITLDKFDAQLNLMKTKWTKLIDGEPLVLNRVGIEVGELNLYLNENYELNVLNIFPKTEEEKAAEKEKADSQEQAERKVLNFKIEELRLNVKAITFKSDALLLPLNISLPNALFSFEINDFEGNNEELASLIFQAMKSKLGLPNLDLYNISAKSIELLGDAAKAVGDAVGSAVGGTIDASKNIGSATTNVINKATESIKSLF